MDFYIIAIVLLTIISIISFLFFRYISAVERGVSIVKKDVENLKQLIIEFKREKAPIMVTPQMKQNLEQIHEYTKPQENLEEIQLGKQPTPEQHQPVQQPTQEVQEVPEPTPVQQPTQEAPEPTPVQQPNKKHQNNIHKFNNLHKKPQNNIYKFNNPYKKHQNNMMRINKKMKVLTPIY